MACVSSTAGILGDCCQCTYEGSGDFELVLPSSRQPQIVHAPILDTTQAIEMTFSNAPFQPAPGPNLQCSACQPFYMRTSTGGSQFVLPNCFSFFNLQNQQCTSVFGGCGIVNPANRYYILLPQSLGDLSRFGIVNSTSNTSSIFLNCTSSRNSLEIRAQCRQIRFFNN